MEVVAHSRHIAQVVNSFRVLFKAYEKGLVLLFNYCFLLRINNANTQIIFKKTDICKISN